jgi:hypothetical protein
VKVTSLTSLATASSWASASARGYFGDAYPYDPGMDAATAEQLRTFAEEARARLRRGEEAEAIAEVEARYDEIREALDWCLAAGRPDDAFGIATALVPFWLATTRIDEADAWYERASPRLPQPAAPARGTGAPRPWVSRVLRGTLRLARQRFAESRQVAEEAGNPNLVALALAGSARVACATIRPRPSGSFARPTT